MPSHKSKGFRRPILLFTKIESKVENQIKEEQNILIDQQQQKQKQTQ
jgi:hypothetical protein